MPLTEEAGSGQRALGMDSLKLEAHNTVGSSVLLLRIERHLDPFDWIPLSVPELNGSLPELGFIHDFEDERVQTRAKHDAWQRLLNRNRAVRHGGFVNLPPIQIYFRFILTADQHLKPALFF